MELPGEIRSALGDALCAAFNDSELRSMTRNRLNIDLSRITAPASMPDQALALIDWVERQGRLNELIEEAVAERPRNQLLQDAAAAWRAWDAARNAKAEESVPALGVAKPDVPQEKPRRSVWTAILARVSSRSMFLGAVVLVVFGTVAWGLSSFFSTSRGSLPKDEIGSSKSYTADEFLEAYGGDQTLGHLLGTLREMSDNAQADDSVPMRGADGQPLESEVYVKMSATFARDYAGFRVRSASLGIRGAGYELIDVDAFLLAEGTVTQISREEAPAGYACQFSLPRAAKNGRLYVFLHYRGRKGSLTPETKRELRLEVL